MVISADAARVLSQSVLVRVGWGRFLIDFEAFIAYKKVTGI